MNDLIDGTRVARGTIKIHGIDIYQRDVDVIELRKRVGMVFQKSNPFPEIDLRKHHLWPAAAGHDATRRSSMRSSSDPCAAPRSGTK